MNAVSTLVKVDARDLVGDARALVPAAETDNDNDNDIYIYIYSIYNDI